MNEQNSAMINIRELIQMGEARAEEERLAKIRFEQDARQRAANEKARIAAEAERKAKEAEKERLDAELRARELEAKIEAERAERELRVRLEIEADRRAHTMAMKLAHEQRLAEMEMAITTKISRRRWTYGLGFLGAVVLVVGGVFIRSELQQSQALIRDSANQVEALRQEANRSGQLLHEIQNRPIPLPIAPPVPAPVVVQRNNANPSPRPTPHPVVRSDRVHPTDDFSDLNGDAVTAVGLEGGPQRHR